MDDDDGGQLRAFAASQGTHSTQPVVVNFNFAGHKLLLATALLYYDDVPSCHRCEEVWKYRCIGEISGGCFLYLSHS